MPTLANKSVETVPLSEKETEMARESGQTIAEFVNGEECLRLTLARDTGEHIETKIPARALHLLAHILDEMAQGNSVTLIPLYAELSTHQAAAVMHVSRPYLIKLLEGGKIPYRKVGAHRRVRYDDLLAYMEQEQKARKVALKELIAEQERLGLYE